MGEITNAAALNQGIASGFGDVPDSQARKKKKEEQQHDQPAEPSLMDTLKSMVGIGQDAPKKDSGVGKALKGAESDKISNADALSEGIAGGFGDVPDKKQKKK